MSGQPEINGQAVVLLFFAPLPFQIFFGVKKLCMSSYIVVRWEYTRKHICSTMPCIYLVLLKVASPKITIQFGALLGRSCPTNTSGSKKG